jgi:succinate-acetate transporter protein
MSQSIDIGVHKLDKQAWQEEKASPVGPTPVHPASFIGNPAPLGLLAFGMTTCEFRRMAVFVCYIIAGGEIAAGSAYSSGG